MGESDNITLSKIHQDVRDIKKALQGDDYGAKGIVQQVQDNYHYIEKLKEQQVLDKVCDLEEEQNKEKKWRWGLTGGFSVLIIMTRYWENIVKMFGK